MDFVKQSVPRKLVTFTNPKAVGLTYDGPYKEVYYNAFPLHQKYGFTASIAIDPWVTSTWEQMREMQAAGWTIALHTIDLYKVQDYKQEIDEEVRNIYNHTKEYPKEWIALGGSENYSMIEYTWNKWSFMDRQLGLGTIKPYLLDSEFEKVMALFESEAPVILTYTHRVQNETDINYDQTHDVSITNFTTFIETAHKKNYLITGNYDVWAMLKNQIDAKISDIWFNNSYYQFNLITNDRPAYLNIYDYFKINNATSLYLWQELGSDNYTQIYSTFPHEIQDGFKVKGKNKTYRLSKKIYLNLGINTKINITINKWRDSKDIYVFSETSNNSSTVVKHEIVVGKPNTKYNIKIKKNGILLSTLKKKSNNKKVINFTYNQGYNNSTIGIEIEKEGYKGDFNGNEIIDIGDATYVA
ncbi:MAG: polysaccharide deacetylase family protein, partial [Methanosarcinales archaeon]